MQVVRIFLSSPGDCHKERQATHEVVETLNKDPLVSSFTKVEVVAWDWSEGVPLDAISSPQVSVNKHLPLPEDCEVFIGIYRRRFGTPLPVSEFRKEDGSLFLSGSEYEFDRAWKARRLGRGLPEILIYRSKDAGNEGCSDDQQVRRIQEFFNSAPFKDEDGWTGSFGEFDDLEDYKKQVNYHLRRVFSQWHPSARQPLPFWLSDKTKKFTRDAGPRYTELAHVDSEISKSFDWLLLRKEVVLSIDKMLSKIWSKTQGIDEFSALQKELSAVARQFRADPYWRNLPDLCSLSEALQKVSDIAWGLISESNSNAEDNSYKQHQLATVSNDARDVIDLIRRYFDLASKRVLLLSGEAGQGKTHTLVHEVNRTLSEGGLAVGVLGQTLSSADDLTTALHSKLDYAAAFSLFLDSLQNAAEQSGERALIVIDALNETPNRQRWKYELSGILEEILDRPNLVVAISVRSDYLKHVLPSAAGGQNVPWVQIEHTGFSNVETDALNSYCKHYGVKVPVAPPLGELGNPLYMQLLVKSLQGKPPVVQWLPSWLEVWSSWIDRLEDEAIGAIDIDPSRPEPIHRTLKQIAKKMLERSQFYLSRGQAEEVAQSTAGNKSIISFLCSAGALIDRIDDDNEIIEYGFERLSDTFVVDRLLNKLFEGAESQAECRLLLKNALSPGGMLSQLATPNYDSSFLAIHRAGLLEALCLAAPAKAGVEVPELIAEEEPDQHGIAQEDWELRQAFTDSFRWRYQPDEFALGGQELRGIWKDRGCRFGEADSLDELIRLSLIPGHPFAFENILHKKLLGMKGLGERDRLWSVPLVEVWHQDNSCLEVVIHWATHASLEGLNESIALPIARLLAWASSVPQQGMRKDAIHGLTRVLVSCPTCLPRFLADFIVVDDAYVVEAALIATWGVVIDGRDSTLVAQAAKTIYDVMFRGGNPRWCHLTIRHYSRKIVEDAYKKGLLSGIDFQVVCPPYKSSLPLEQVPDEDKLRRLDSASGFGSIVGSALGHDFYWYVMGATSGSKPFSSQPLPNSNEPVRPYHTENASITISKPSNIFDIPLAARFVVWNCLNLGWTGERFDKFDTGYYVQDSGRISRPGRTERVGKKYQWIGWQTMLAFLADNYEMTPERRDQPRVYDSPKQISYIEVFDPSRWLQDSIQRPQKDQNKDFWKIASMPPWPKPNKADIQRWATNTTYDLPSADVICTIPSLPESWGEGPWMRVAAENIWDSTFAPGTWALGYDYSADIWRQITPALIRAEDLPLLIEDMQRPETQEKIDGFGRHDYDSDWDTPLAEWPFLGNDFNRGFEANKWDVIPVPWMPLAGSSGHPDRDDERSPVIVPWPRLFREWGLALDLRNGVVHRNGQVVFGLASWSIGEDALFARSDILWGLLEEFGYTLIWMLRGERRTWLEINHLSEAESRAWVDTSGIAFWGKDRRVHTAYMIRKELD